MKYLSLKGSELKISQIVLELKRGNKVIVTHRSKIIAKILPVPERPLNSTDIPLFK